MVTAEDRTAGLELVRDFVNTRDVEGGDEELATPASLRRWLAARGLLGPGEHVGAGDVEQVRAVREALRALLVANNGGELDPAAAATLDAAARRARLALRFGADGGALHEPAAAGVDAALGHLLAIVAVAQADGTWARLKACRGDDCRWAFLDHARNRSRVWCSMAVCGNRAKARAYRSRRSRG